MDKFNRENRYIVLKISDLKKLRGGQTESLRIELAKVTPRLPKRDCLVIESDWPEYEPTWRAIEARVKGQPAFDEAAERAAFEAWWSGFYRVPIENLPYARTEHGYCGHPTNQAWMSWLACARLKAGQPS